MKYKKKSLLWQIDDLALARPSFLFGTMHVRDERAFQFLDEVFDSLNRCEALATEYHVDDQPAPHLQQVMLLPAGTELHDYFRPAQYQKIHRILLRAFGINLDHFARFVPLLAINQIGEQLLSRDRPQALDLALWNRAGAIGKTRLGIETLDEQLQVLQHIPLEQQLQQLRNLARNVGKFRRATLKNAALYQTADPHRLYQAVRQSSQGLRRLLLFQRNRIMAERIAGIVQQQPTLCAVGAGHLAGEEGLIRLLKQRGFRLRPISIHRDTAPK